MVKGVVVGLMRIRVGAFNGHIDDLEIKRYIS